MMNLVYSNLQITRLTGHYYRINKKRKYKLVILKPVTALPAVARFF
jgi:hypothetical protein